MVPVAEVTTEVLVIVYAPAEIPRAQLQRVVEVTASRLAEVAGGHETGRTLI